MSIKQTRAQSLALIGRAPLTFAAIWAAIPEPVKARCTAAELAGLADAMQAQHMLGHDEGYKDATP